MSRLLGAVALTLWVGCFTAASESDLAPGDDDGLIADACVTDQDCVLAGPSCCECPTFALPADSGWQDACEQVDCPAPSACPALVARCDQAAGMCVAVCAPVACDLQCREGFAVDAAGCTVCMCGAGPTAPECTVDGDCARVPGDCCGCERGGIDVAVPASQAGTYVDDLMCTGNEACPGVSTCDPGAEPRCQAGQCVLATGGSAPPDDGECGRPDQPPCPDGTVCVINSADGEAGTGRCEAPSP